MRLPLYGGDIVTAADWLAERRRIEQAATDGPWVREWSTPDQWWIIHGQPNPAKGDDRMVCPEVATLQHPEDWTADVDFITDARTAMPKALAALEAVLARHPWECLECEGIDLDASPRCGHCYEPWPCPTVAAITEALGAES